MLIEQQFLSVRPRDPTVVPAETNEVKSHPVLWMFVRLLVILHFYVIARDKALFPVQFSPVPVHIIFHVQYLKKASIHELLQNVTGPPLLSALVIS